MLEIENDQLEMENSAIRRRSIRRASRALGIGILVGAAVILATKRVLDEIFIEDEWDDIDWGEGIEEDLDYMID